jgi:hypothetical protein
MTWINSDLNKIAKQIEMDVTNFHYDTPYNVSLVSGGTTAYNKGFGPLIFANKQIISGVDFLPVYNYTAVTPNIPYFKFSDLDTGTYIYIFEVVFNYKGHSANEVCSRYCQLQVSNSGAVDKIWNISSIYDFMSPAYRYVNTVNTDDPIIGFDYWVSQGSADYTVDRSNPEKSKFIFFLGGNQTGGAYTLPFTGSFSFAARLVLTSTTATTTITGTISNVSLTVKRIKKV